VRSQLESPATVSPATSSAGESANGDVVVFQLSEEMLRQLLGDSATEMLQTFNAQLPGGIRQTYALIPLSSPVGATVPQVQPLLAASGLSTLADSRDNPQHSPKPATLQHRKIRLQPLKNHCRNGSARRAPISLLRKHHRSFQERTKNPH
jgi:hypothetical protein